MPHVLGVRTTIFCVPGCSLVACAAAARTRSRAPRPRSRRPTSSSTFRRCRRSTLPPAPADGSHSVKELRVKGKKLLDTDITVHGFITWAYDCPTAVRKPDETDKDSPEADRRRSDAVRAPEVLHRRRQGHAGREEPVGRRRAAPVQQARDGAHEEAGAAPAGSLRAEREGSEEEHLPAVRGRRRGRDHRHVQDDRRRTASGTPMACSSTRR